MHTDLVEYTLNKQHFLKRLTMLAPNQQIFACQLQVLLSSCRFGIKLPRYQQIVNALTWMSHSQTLRRVSREFVIDLYLRPPVSRFRLMDFHLMDRIVRDANR